DLIADRFRAIAGSRDGPQAILPYSYAGTMGLLQGSSLDRRFFHRLGASQLDRTICSSAGMTGSTMAYGVRYGTEPEQFKQSKLIIAWGANILGTNVHMWPFIVEARRQGARFYTIDPVKNRTGKLADKHFFINPGTDLALALGLMHVILEEGLFDREYVHQHTIGLDGLRKRVTQHPPGAVEEITGIPREEIVSLAREYATTRPAAIRLNYGVQRSDRGASAVYAISMLPVLTGSLRDVGGGMVLSTSQAFQFNRDALTMPELQERSPLGRPARIINMSELGNVLSEVDDPPVKALVVYNSNPAAIAPDQSAVNRGLRREDLFTVVLEQMQTDTADYADILLPSTTFLEHTDLYLAYGHYYVQLARPALPAPGETRSNLEVFRALAKRLGFADSCFDDTEDDMIQATLSSGHPFLEGITLERLDRERSIRLNLPEPFRPFAEGEFATPSGRCDLDHECLDFTAPVESRRGDPELLAKYPLEMVSSKNDDSMNSTFGNRLDADRDTAKVFLHTLDAERRGISTGDAVRVFNARGTCVLEAEVDGVVPEGVVRVPSTRWAKKSPLGASVNVLTSQRLTDYGGG
ncbi:MAG TPA: molybdopterin-dependent oxidoreductase, partial [Bryobacteraceae bacterium]|nr:molybdopterin-dependent oxidoreductase [Bryobacteraceae bacterium]